MSVPLEPDDWRVIHAAMIAWVEQMRAEGVNDDELVRASWIRQQALLRSLPEPAPPAGHRTP